MSIQDALQNNMISYTITSGGGHLGNCINMQLTNLTDRSLSVKLESGRNLISVDTNKQDILVVKEEIFVMNSGQTLSKPIFGFCSQSHKSSTDLGETYSVGNMKDKTTVQLTEYLSQNEFPLPSMQNAVWVLTNNRRVEGIFHENRDSIQALMDYVSGLTRQFTPWYSIEYQPNEEHLVSDAAKSIHGNFEGYLASDTKIKIVVFDKFNIPQQRTEMKINERGYSHPVVVDVSKLPKGRYHLGFFLAGGGRVDEKVFTI